jgi:hypothetical protein
MHLQHGIDVQSGHHEARVDVVHAEYEEAFPDLVRWLTAGYGDAPLPTFASSTRWDTTRRRSSF